MKKKMTMSAKLLLLILCLRWILALSEEGYCEDKDQRSVCCANYYPVNGSCVECPNGKTSTIGGNECKVCQDGYYGQNYALKCMCEMQKCNPVDGSCSIYPDTVTTEIWDIDTVTKENDYDTTTKCNTQTNYVFVLTYGTILALSVITLALGLVAIFSVITRNHRSNELTIVDIKSIGTQVSASAPSDNAYYSTCDLDRVTLRQSPRRISSLPNITDIDDYYESIDTFRPKSEGYLNFYQSLRAAWKEHRPKYASDRQSRVKSDCSDYFIPRRVKSNEIVVMVDAHQLNQTSNV